MTKNGFHLSIEGAMLAIAGDRSNVTPWGSLKIGRNF